MTLRRAATVSMLVGSMALAGCGHPGHHARGPRHGQPVHAEHHAEHHAKHHTAPHAAAHAGVSADFPYDSQFVDVFGSRMHYVESGRGEPILFLHGNPTSSYLWRNVIPSLSPHGRAIALDLIGFGGSDKPDLDYTFQDHYRYLEGFIDALGLERMTLVIHDWGSVLGLEYARRHPEKVRAVAMMEAIVPPAFPLASYEAMGEARGERFRQFRNPETGRPLLMEQNVFIEQILGRATLTRSMTEAEMTRYRAPFPTPESRFPIYVWPRELPIGGEPARNVEVVRDVGEWLETSDTPKLLLYARPGAIISPEAALAMQQRYRHLEAIFVGPGSHYIQEDQPEAIGRNIALWYQRLPGRAPNAAANVAAGGTPDGATGRRNPERPD